MCVTMIVSCARVTTKNDIFCCHVGHRHAYDYDDGLGTCDNKNEIFLLSHV